METAYWNHQPFQPSAIQPKRQRMETDVATGAFTGHEAQIFPSHNEHGNIQSMNDTRALGASYDRYLQEKQQLFSYGTAQVGLTSVSRSTDGETSGLRGGKIGFFYQDPIMSAGPAFRSFGPPDLVANNTFGIQNNVDHMVRPFITEREIPLPPDASCTLFVEGLPHDTAEREVAHIFRPFLGYKEVRLVKKEPKYDGGSPVLLCFVDFTTPSYAMVAMGAIEGYRMDLHDPESSALRLHFAKFSSQRPNQGFHGRR